MSLRVLSPFLAFSHLVCVVVSLVWRRCSKDPRPRTGQKGTDAGAPHTDRQVQMWLRICNVQVGTAMDVAKTHTHNWGPKGTTKSIVEGRLQFA